MVAHNSSRSGGQILVDALVGHGADMAFCVPGESFLAVIDGLYERRDVIRLITCRHEAGAGHMAEAYGKLTGAPGICFVTRGPGASHAAIAVHTARQDSTPLILFVGQVDRDASGREAWQEIDYRQMFGGIAKWVDQIDSVQRIPEYVSRAFHVATAGRPGPVVLALPEDMLSEFAAVEDCRRYRRHASAPSPEALRDMVDALATAQRPLMIVGGGGWTRQAADDIAAFAEAFDLPVSCSFRRQDIVDNAAQIYAGEAGLGMNPKLAKRIGEADFILAVGPRLGETTTSGYSLLASPDPAQTLIHVHADPEELGRVYRADLPIAATMPGFAAAARGLSPAGTPCWRDWTASARADYLAYCEPDRAMPGDVDLAHIMLHLRETLPADTIVCNGAGNYTLWVQRFYRYRGLRTQLAPTSGVMGYGLPAALAAKLVHPQRTVVCFAGDGCFLMSGQELATAVQYALPVLIIVVNNGIYGSIRMHQERRYPGRTYGVELATPDFAELARAYGAHGETVTRTEEFAGALARSLETALPALIELRVSPDALTPRMNFGETVRPA